MSIAHFVGDSRFSRPVLPPVSTWGRLKHTWIGHDGSEWEISDPDSGAFLVKAGVRGLGMPDHERFTTSSPAVHGDLHRGSRVLPREVFWPLYLFHDGGSAEFVGRDRAFWASMSRDRLGTWRVESPDSVRELRCYFVDADDAFERDPTFFGWATYGVRLEAADPFWRSAWVTRTFSNAGGGPVDFFNNGAAPAFHISSSSQLATSDISNPGDEPSYLVYVLHGPFDSAEVGLGPLDTPGPLTSYLEPVEAGQSVVIDTRPSTSSTARLIATPTAEPGSLEWEQQVFTAPGTSAFGGVGSLALNSPLQPGEGRALRLTMVGEGSVTVAHRPPHLRAW